MDEFVKSKQGVVFAMAALVGCGVMCFYKTAGRAWFSTSCVTSKHRWALRWLQDQRRTTAADCEGIRVADRDICPTYEQA